jgi:uncharacterized protein YqeY
MVAGMDTPTVSDRLRQALSEALKSRGSARRVLSDDDLTAIVRTEVSEREAAAFEYERIGRTDRAGRLRREAEVLAAAVAVET